MSKKHRGMKALLFLLIVMSVAPAWAVPQIPNPSGSNPRPIDLLPGQSATLLPSGQWLLLGGQGTNGPVSTAMLQDPRTGAATALKTGMLLARAWHSATLLPNGLVLVIGGTGSVTSVIPPAEVFDPNSQAPGITVSGLLPRAHHTATLLTDGSVLVVGGVGNDGAPVALVERWDAQARHTSILQAELENGRRDHTATLLSDGTVLLWGGTDARGDSISYADLYDPDSRSFSVATVDSNSPPDLNVPFLESSLPPDGATEVAPDILIALRFSKPLQVETVTHVSVRLIGPSGLVSAKIVPSEGGMLCFVTPNAPLQAGATYILSLQGPTDTRKLSLVSKDVTFTVAGNETSGNSASKNGSTAKTSAANLPPLVAPPGITALSGQVLRLDGTPLANVSLSIGNHTTLSDRTGRFLLQNIEDGNRILLIEGRTANKGGTTYGLYEDGVSITAKQTNILTYKIWMTALDTAHEVHIPSPTISEIVVTTPLIPGLELHIPPKTVIHDYYGKVVTKVGITPVPVDRPPFPLPQGFRIPVYFTIQPGDAILDVRGDGTKGARLVYPNTDGASAGARGNFWKYGPANGEGWYAYGYGTVTPDRTQIAQNPGSFVWSFTPMMFSPPTNAPPAGPNPQSHPDGDPVDVSTGLFVYRHTDSYLPDMIPINITRTYRQADAKPRAFGVGTTIGYDISLVGDTSQYSYTDLVLPDGGRIHYYRTSPGTSYLGAVFTHNSTPTIFYGSTISYQRTSLVNGLWILRFKDGTVWTFPDVVNCPPCGGTPLLSIQDRYGNTLTISRPTSDNISQITSPNGRWVQLTYDSCNRIQQITDDIGRSTYYSYDNSNCSLGRLHTVTDPDQGVTTYCWFGSACPNSSAPSKTESTSYHPAVHDSAPASGSSPTPLEWVYVGIPGCATSTEMTSIIDARNIEYLQNQYDTNCRVQTQTLTNTGTYTFNYVLDSTGYVTQTQVTDPNSSIRVYNIGPPDIYPDGFYTGGYLQSAILAQGKPEQQQFTLDYGTAGSNPGKLLLNLTDPLNRVSNYTYDAFGSIISVTRLAGTSNAATTSFTYEPTFSRVTSITDPLSHTTTATYNDSINQTLVTDPRGYQWTMLQNPLGQIVSWQDPAGDAWQLFYSGADLTTVEDPLGNTTTYLYDGAGRTLSAIDPLGERTSFTYDGLNDLLTVTDPLGEVTQYGYDPNGNLTSVTDPKNTANPTQFLYNNMDQMYQRTDALGHSDGYQYDLNGNPTCHTDRKGQITVYGYDGLNRRTSAGYGTASCTATTFQNSTGYTYDDGNRLKTVVDTLVGTINRNYDGLDDLNYENTPRGTINYIFDSARRRTSMTVTGQTQVTYGYDASNNLQQIQQGTTAINLTYDNVGRRSSLVLPNGITVQYSYDAGSHETGITYQEAATSLGNLIYTYDTLGRLSQVTGSYARSNLPAALSSAGYNVANQITTWGSTGITYDLNGNLQYDGSNTYTWDLRNQLSAISGGTTATLQYDGLRRRIGKTINGTSAAFLFDDKNIVQELSGSKATANLLPGLRMDEIFARTVSSGANYYLSDALGSTLALTSATGAVQRTYTYEPYGKTTASGTSSTNAFQYTGRENDGDGLYFYRTRYYEPGFGRFTSEDPIDFAGGINLYAYVGNSPTNFIDPLGETWPPNFPPGMNPGSPGQRPPTPPWNPTPPTTWPEPPNPVGPPDFNPHIPPVTDPPWPRIPPNPPQTPPNWAPPPIPLPSFPVWGPLAVPFVLTQSTAAGCADVICYPHPPSKSRGRN